MYRVSKMIGGGESHWYLFAPCGRIVDVAHERDEYEVNWLYRIADFLNVSLQHNICLSEAA